MARKKTPHDRLVELLGDVSLSTETAFIAAAINLMEAGEICKENRDREGLINVAEAWHDIAKSLGGVEEEETKRPFGFVAETEIVEIGEELGEPDDPSEGGIEVRKELGKLRKRTR